MKDLEIKYTLAFCFFSGKVLMLKRIKNPNINLWNGLGGKIEQGETPTVNILRELKEEAGISEDNIEKTEHKGIVSWEYINGEKSGGTHLFFIHLKNTDLINTLSDEGELDWKDEAWAREVTNTAVVENIPLFLNDAFVNKSLKEYHFIYFEKNRLKEYFLQDLTIDIESE